MSAAPGSERPSHPLTLLYGEAPPPTLRRDNTALVVVDMQYFDAHPDWGEGKTIKKVGAEAAFAYYFERLQEIIPNVQALLSTSRQAGVEVIHARMAELTRDSRDAGPRQRAFGLRVPRGSPDAEIVPEAAPLEDEIVLDRSGAALFPTTNVERLLRNLGTRTVLIAGTSIDGGIEATIRNAADRDWDVVLLSDASALFWQLDGPRTMAGGLTTVMTVAELAGALRAS